MPRLLPDQILENSKKHFHALDRDKNPVENAETLMEHIENENPLGDLVISPDDAVDVIDPLAIYNEIRNGGSW